MKESIIEGIGNVVQSKDVITDEEQKFDQGEPIPSDKSMKEDTEELSSQDKIENPDEENIKEDQSIIVDTKDDEIPHEEVNVFGKNDISEDSEDLIDLSITEPVNKAPDFDLLDFSNIKPKPQLEISSTSSDFSSEDEEKIEEKKEGTKPKLQISNHPVGVDANIEIEKGGFFSSNKEKHKVEIYSEQNDDKK